jgi:hypothetical protein
LRMSVVINGAQILLSQFEKLSPQVVLNNLTPKHLGTSATCAP